MMLIIGGTGSLGRTITRMLLDQGKPVRALARPESNTRPLADAGAQIVLGDLKERSSLDLACDGVDVVITTANSALRGGADNPQTVDLEGNRNLIDATKMANVRQLIFVSAMAADPDSRVPLLAAKGKTERHLADSGTPYTILAPNAFMDFWIGVYIGLRALQDGEVTIAGEGRRRHSFIAAVDVARFVLAAVGNAHAINRKVWLGGPEAVTFLHAVAAYERALGKSIPVRSVRTGEPIPALPESVWALAASFEAFDSPIEMAETTATFGVRLTSLNEFVQRSVDNFGR